MQNIMHNYANFIYFSYHFPCDRHLTCDKRALCDRGVPVSLAFGERSEPIASTNISILRCSNVMLGVEYIYSYLYMGIFFVGFRSLYSYEFNKVIKLLL